MLSSWPESLLWQHYVMAQFGGASIGLISPGISAIALEIGASHVVIHAVLAEPSTQVVDDLDHMCFELDVLIEGHTAISHQEVIGLDSSWPPPDTFIVWRAYDGPTVNDTQPPAP